MNCAPSRIEGYGDYEWENPERLADIPRLPDELFQILVSREAPSTSSRPRHAPALDNSLEPILEASEDLTHDCELLCRCLPRSFLDNYESWIKLGFCLKGLGCPLELWDAVSQRSPKYRPGDCARKWPGFSATGSTSLDCLIAWAKKGNPELFHQLHPTLRMNLT